MQNLIGILFVTAGLLAGGGLGHAFDTMYAHQRHKHPYLREGPVGVFTIAGGLLGGLSSLSMVYFFLFK